MPTDNPPPSQKDGPDKPQATDGGSWISRLFAKDGDESVLKISQHMGNGVASLTLAGIGYDALKSLSLRDPRVDLAYLGVFLLVYWAVRMFMIALSQAFTPHELPKWVINRPKLQHYPVVLAAVASAALCSAGWFVGQKYLDKSPSVATHQQTPPAAHHASSWRFAVSVTEQDH